MQPLLIGSRPASIIRSVLLPQPEGPRMEMNCRPATSILMLRKTSSGPPSLRKVLLTFDKRTNASTDLFVVDANIVTAATHTQSLMPRRGANSLADLRATCHSALVSVNLPAIALLKMVATFGRFASAATAYFITRSVCVLRDSKSAQPKP